MGPFNIFVVFGESRLPRGLSGSGWQTPCVGLFSAKHLLCFQLILIFFFFPHKSCSALGFQKELKSVSLFSSGASPPTLADSYTHMLVVGDLALLAMNAIAFLFLCLSLFSSSSRRSNMLRPLSHSPCYLRSALSYISACGLAPFFHS